MTCESCGNKPKNTAKDFTRAVIEIDNPETLVLLRKVVIPTSMGTEEQVPAAIGKYKNVILYYEANKHVYIYSSDGIPTFLETEIPQEVWDRIQSLETNLAKEAKDREDADKVLQDNIDAEAKTREDADTALDGRLTTVEGIAATALQPESINKVVMTDISLSANSSTTTVQIDGAKENLLTGAQTTKNLSLPVASHDEAGVMNSATFDAVTTNTSNINALMNGAVAITGLSASPSQSDLTTAWETETGLTSLMNRAGIYDVTNDKVWTYYSNTSTWYAASNTSQVTINTFTNSSEGTIKGSTNVGQVFAENDGTGSVNGWDTLSGNVSTNTNNISSLQTGKQDKLTAGANITISAQNVISATGANYTAGNAITIDPSDNNRIDAAVYPADFFTAGDSVEGEGSSITINKTIEAPIKSVEVKGDTFQQTYSGKNLLKPNVDKTVAGVSAVWNDDGTITLNGTATANADMWIGNGDATTAIAFSVPAGESITQSFEIVSGTPAQSASTWSLRTIAYYNDATHWGDIVNDITFTSASYEVGIRGTEILVQSGAVFNNLTLKIQLEKSSTATSWEKFVGGTASPNPDYPQDINVVTGAQTVKVTGKNLFDGSLELGGIDIYTGVNSNAVDRVRTADYVSAQPNTVYTISGVLASRYAIFYDSSKTYLGYVLVDAQKTKGTFTTPADTAYIRWYIIQLDANVDEQLELGSTATSYEPYQSTTKTVDLGSTELAKIGTYVDSIFKNDPTKSWYNPDLEDNAWYVHKENGKGTLTGTTEGMQVAQQTGTGRFNIVLPTTWEGYKKLAGSTTFSKCNSYIVVAQGTTNGNFDTNASNYNYALNFNSSVANSLRIKNIDLSTEDDMKSSMTATPLVLYYVLATPTDTKITDTNLIADLEDLADATSYLDTTHFTVTATGTSLPMMLDVVVASKSLASILAMLNIFTNNEWDALWA